MQDLFAVLTLAITMGYTGAAPTLAKKRPPSVLLSSEPITSLCAQSLLQLAFQFAALLLLHSQQFYFPPFNNHTKLNAFSMNTTVLYHVCMFELIFSCISLSVGAPWRKEFWTNKGFCLALILLLGFEVWLLVGENQPVNNFLELYILPRYFQYVIITLGLLYFVFAFFIEWVLSGLACIRCKSPSAPSPPQHQLDYIQIN